MKCYQHDNNGYFLFETDDYGQGLPRNATYVESLDEKEGYLVKYNGETWEYEELPKEPEQPESTLEELKIVVIFNLKSSRDQKEAGGFSYLGKVFDSDEKACQRISIAAQNAGFAMMSNQEFSPIKWTCQDNTSMSLNGQQLLGLSVALAEHSATMHGIYNQLKTLVDQTATLEELKEIQWPDLGDES